MNYKDYLDYAKYSILSIVYAIKTRYKKLTCDHDYLYQGEHVGFNVFVCSKCHKIKVDEI